MPSSISTGKQLSRMATSCPCRCRMSASFSSVGSATDPAATATSSGDSSACGGPGSLQALSGIRVKSNTRSLVLESHTRSLVLKWNIKAGKDADCTTESLPAKFSVVGLLAKVFHAELLAKFSVVTCDPTGTPEAACTAAVGSHSSLLHTIQRHAGDNG